MVDAAAADARPVLLVTKGLDIGGLERVVVDLAVTMTRRGVPVEVAVVNDERGQLIPALLDAGVKVHRLGGTDRIGWRAVRSLTRLVRNDDFRVIHVHGPLPSVVARLARNRRPIVTTSHTPFHALRAPTGLLWRLTAFRDAKVVAVSAVVAGSLPRRTAARASVLPHGIDRDAIAAAVAAVLPSHRSDLPNTVTAVAVASHRDVKNYPNLLRAVLVARGLGAPLRLVAVGAGPDLERHRALAQQLGLTDFVDFVAPSSGALREIAAADILVVASDHEGQPLVVLEAMALGKPIVATAVGRVPELVGPAVGRVVAPGDAIALGAAFAEVAGDDDLRRRMGDAALRQGSTWTLDDVVDAHLTLYSQVCAT